MLLQDEIEDLQRDNESKELHIKYLKEKHINFQSTIKMLKATVASLQNQIDQMDCKSMCGICESKIVNSVFLPCNHAYACKTCAKKCKVCPVCRAELGVGELFL